MPSLGQALAASWGRQSRGDPAERKGLLHRLSNPHPWAMCGSGYDGYMPWVNSLSPGRCGSNFNSIKHIQTSYSGNRCEMRNQHWFMWWLGAVRQQAITWASVDLDVAIWLRINELTHWGRWIWNFDSNFTKVDSYRSKWWQVSIGLGNGLVSRCYGLTHWSPDKMAAVLRATFF